MMRMTSLSIRFLKLMSGRMIDISKGLNVHRMKYICNPLQYFRVRHGHCPSSNRIGWRCIKLNVSENFVKQV